MSLALPGAAVAAGGAPVPGATYTGTTSAGTTVTITVSSDGSQIVAYKVSTIFGTNTEGTCEAVAESDQGAWPGASITNGSFSYVPSSVFSISGTFDGAQTASGTFTYHQPAAGSVPGCSAGTVNWTASTQTAPPGGSSNSGSGSGSSSSGSSSSESSSSGSGSGSSGSGSAEAGSGAGSTAIVQRKSLAVRVTLRRVHGQSFGGSLKASSKTCVARRDVYLYAGRKRVRTVLTTTGGAFTFTLSSSGQRIHVAVGATSKGTVGCAAGSSSTIKT